MKTPNIKRLLQTGKALKRLLKTGKGASHICLAFRVPRELDVSWER